MSKLVNWGHWLAGLGLLSSGVWSLAYCVDGIPEPIRLMRSVGESKLPENAGISFNLAAFYWIPLLVAAWGILRWQAWGHLFSGVFAVAAVLGIALQKVLFPGDFGRFYVVSLIIACAFMVWLLLPSVRAAHWSRERTA